MTKHTDNCTRIFKKYDKNCPRCQELITGAAPREGWQKSYYEQKTRNEAIRRSYNASQICNHNNLNAGGYCMTCGRGRDFS